MIPSSFFLLLGAAAAVAILHAILPDHWVPLAIIARTQRWSIMRVVRVTILAAAGHLISSLLLAGILALIGLKYQHELDVQQGHIIGGILTLTGLVFLIWGLLFGEHGHRHSSVGHTHHYHFKHEHEHIKTGNHSNDDHSHEHKSKKLTKQQTFAGRLAAIAVPFGVAASPDLTILPVALAASTSGVIAVVIVLSVFIILTLTTFVGLTVIATLVGYQIKGAWIEKNTNTVTSLVLITIGVIAYIGF